MEESHHKYFCTSHNYKMKTEELKNNMQKKKYFHHRFGTPHTTWSSAEPDDCKVAPLQAAAVKLNSIP